MKKFIWYEPKYQPSYPEYKWRCGMRCGNIWRCWGAKSFYSKLIRLWYQTKSTQAVLDKLNMNPEWSAQKLAEEWHLVCDSGNSDFGGSLTKFGYEEAPISDCFLARHPGYFGSTNMCYDFWEWWYIFQFGEKNTAPKKKTSKTAAVEYGRSAVSCWGYVSIEDLHVLCDRYWIDYVLYQLNEEEIEPQPDYIGDDWYIVVDWKKECFCGYWLYSNCIKGGSTKGVKKTCWRKRKCSSLLTYEELEEMHYATPVLEELNSRPEEYFHSLTEHLTQDSDYPNIWHLGNGCRSFSESMRFDTSVNLRTSLSCYQ